ncbi:MAG: hypothetical protein AB3N64_08845 [Puniceicoccaceae bacterium]
MEAPDHRPRFSEFKERIGIAFTATEVDEESQMHWRLTHCEELPKPPIEELAESDCYWLCFDVGDGPRVQGLYRLETEDGFQAVLTASPYLQHCMQVTVN